MFSNINKSRPFKIDNLELSEANPTSETKSGQVGKQNVPSVTERSRSLPKVGQGLSSLEARPATTDPRIQTGAAQCDVGRCAWNHTSSPLRFVAEVLAVGLSAHVGLGFLSLSVPACFDPCPSPGRMSTYTREGRKTGRERPRFCRTIRKCPPN